MNRTFFDAENSKCISGKRNEWISVEDRLPEENGEYLCWYEYFRYGSYNCMYQTCDRGRFVNGQWGGEPMNGTRAKVLAWMPLPNPPEETANDSI